MIDRTGREMQWHINGRTLAGQCWGDPGQQPMLALHGWLDNSASFAVLGPLLKDYYVVAPDLCGHGRSEHRSIDGGYQIWDDLPDLHELLAALGWERFSLMGHSRGAIIASLLASTLASKVAHLVLLDAVLPQPVAEDEVVKQLRQFVSDRSLLLNRQQRVYTSEEAAVTARQQRGLKAESARLLACRNLVLVEDGYSWSTDPRLQGASAMKLTAVQCRAILRALTMPTLLLLASSASEEQVQSARAAVADMPRGSASTVRGSHHFHMDGDIDELLRAMTQSAASIEVATRI